MSTLRYVITGCAASGTGWASQLMTSLGSECGHQWVFGRRQTRRFGAEGESSWMAIGQLPDLPSVLLIRNPLLVVRSLTAGLSHFLSDSDPQAESTEYVRLVLPDVFDAADHLGRVIRYVAWWDQTVVDSLPIFRVEDAEPPNVATLFSYLTGRQPEGSVVDTLGALGSRVNSHGGDRSTITWKQIRNHPDGDLLVTKAQRFGYPTEDGDHGELSTAT